jgi:hypothetical protein
MLQCVEAEVRQSGDVVAGCVYAKDAAFITRPIAVGKPLGDSQKRVSSL